LGRTDLSRVSEIDRRERIDVLYDQHGARLGARHGNWSASAQLAWLHVSAPWRAAGIGSHLSEQLEQIARIAGDSDMVVSATPSEHTVRFYIGRGLQPMADPLAELFELEPEDVHMRKML
jgi:GNAT superfamily N-acetyltransferase